MGLARLLLQYAVVLDSSDFHVLTPPLIVYLSIARRLTECKLYIFTRAAEKFLRQQKACASIEGRKGDSLTFSLKGRRRVC
jgi:hypothetical protein